MKQILAYILLVVLSFNLRAQNTLDTINLPEVKLIEDKLGTHSIATKVDIIAAQKIGSTQSVADYLSRNSAFYIKVYGALATPTFRGTSSSQTLALWNGIPINSIANGLSDLSLFPINAFDEIAVVHGGDASIFGSGAVGGSIHFNNASNLKLKKNIILTAEQGSFGYNSKTIRMNHCSGSSSFSTSYSTLRNKNEFEFINLSQVLHPDQINNYGNIEAINKQFNYTYKADVYNHFSFNYWESNNEREVPTNMSVSYSDAVQFDNTKRFLFSSNHINDNVALTCL